MQRVFSPRWRVSYESVLVAWRIATGASVRIKRPKNSTAVRTALLLEAIAREKINSVYIFQTLPLDNQISE